jgi:hypothetical protein
MPRNLRETAKFKSDKQRVKKSGRHDWQKMLTIVGTLINGQQEIETTSSVAIMLACANATSSQIGC